MADQLAQQQPMSSDPTELLREIIRQTKRIADRLAPVELLQPIKFNALAAGTYYYTAQSEYNTFLACVTGATLNVFFGGDVTQQPDLTIPPSTSPQEFFLPTIRTKEITITVTGGSVSGVLNVMRY